MHTPLSDPPHGVETGLRRADGSLAQRVGRQAVYLLAGYVLDVVSFVAVLSVVATGMGTLILWAGAPLLAVGLLLAGGFAALERRRVELATGELIPNPNYRQAPPGAGVVE